MMKVVHGFMIYITRSMGYGTRMMNDSLHYTEFRIIYVIPLCAPQTNVAHFCWGDCVLSQSRSQWSRQSKSCGHRIAKPFRRVLNRKCANWNRTNLCSRRLCGQIVRADRRSSLSQVVIGRSPAGIRYFAVTVSTRTRMCVTCGSELRCDTVWGNVEKL